MGAQIKSQPKQPTKKRGRPKKQPDNLSVSVIPGKNESDLEDTDPFQPIPIESLPAQPKKTVPIETLIALRNKGWTLKQIADHVGIKKPSVWERLQRVSDQLVSLDDFKAARADIFAMAQRQILAHGLTTDKLKNASAYQAAGMVSLLHERERLERNQSTANVSFDGLIRSAGDAGSQVDTLASELVALKSRLLTAGIDPDAAQPSDTIEDNGISD